MIGSVLTTGMAGIQTGLSNAQQAGHEIATSQVPEKAGQVDMVSEVTQLMSSEHQVQASARVVEAGSETLGTLLDVKA